MAAPTAAPMTDATIPGGRNKLSANPSTMPGYVITFGNRIVCRSVPNNTMSIAVNTRRAASSGPVHPYREPLQDETRSP
jgi:hypothetical protein